MPQYQRSLTIDADPDELFDYLSEIENLPKYFSRMTEAHSATGDEVHVVARVPEAAQSDGDTVEADATFSIDADQKTISWGSENEHNYHGELEVAPADDGATVTVTLHTEHSSDDINDGIDETLQNVAELVASRPPLQD